MTDFVLIPGAGGEASYWHRITPLLEGAGHHVTAVDLPADDDTASWQEYADAAVAAAGEPRADKLVVVGQSMGGFTAPLVAERLRATDLVLVNAMIPIPGETGGQWWENTGQEQARREFERREGRDADAPFDMVNGFFHDVPAAIAEMIVNGPTRDQSGTPFARPWPMSAWPDVPTRVLAGRDDRLFPTDFQQQVARERLGVEAELIPGGHLVALSRPRQLADALLAPS